MAILFFQFKTNLPATSEDRTTPSVDYISICGKGGNPEFTLGCSYQSDYIINDGVYSARFKGVDINKDGDFVEIEEADIKALRKLLQECDKPEVEMQICLWDEEYPYLEDVLEVTDLKISLEVGVGNEVLSADLGTPTTVHLE